MASELTQNYARAFLGLFEAAEYPLMEDKIKAMLDSVLHEPAWVKFLSAYTLSNEEKFAAIDAAYPKDEFDERYRNFVKVMVKNHRAEMLEATLLEILTGIHEATGVKEGVLFSASPLKPAEVARIEDTFSKRLGYRVKLHPKTDHSLLGGVKVQLDGRVYDGTLRSRLFELQRSLKGGSK